MSRFLALHRLQILLEVFDTTEGVKKAMLGPPRIPKGIPKFCWGAGISLEVWGTTSQNKCTFSRHEWFCSHRRRRRQGQETIRLQTMFGFSALVPQAFPTDIWPKHTLRDPFEDSPEAWRALEGSTPDPILFVVCVCVQGPPPTGAGCSSSYVGFVAGRVRVPLLLGDRSLEGERVAPQDGFV